MKSLVMSEQNWAKLRYQLSVTHPKSVLLSRSKMREVLGFTTRVHREWIEDGDFGSHYKKFIHLDFFDESKRTFFLLKYGDWIR